MSRGGYSYTGKSMKRPVRPADLVDADHRERARFLRSKGVTIAEIARTLGRPWQTVAHWVRNVEIAPDEERTTP